MDVFLCAIYKFSFIHSFFVVVVVAIFGTAISAASNHRPHPLTDLSARLLFFEFIIPSIQIILFCLCIGRNPHDLRIGVVNNDNGNMGGLYLAHLDNVTFTQVRGREREKEREREGGGRVRERERGGG